MPPETAPPTLRDAAFDELDARTGYRLWALRSAVFVVEQDCPYLDLDGRDLEPGARHVWAEQADGAPVGYLRLLDDGDAIRVGRVLVVPAHRNAGLAARLVSRALELAGGRAVRLDAQSHLEHWYERFGFRRDGPAFVEDGIPHVPMLRQPGTGA